MTTTTTATTTTTTTTTAIVGLLSFCYSFFFLLSVSLGDGRDPARDYGPNSWVGIAKTFLVAHDMEKQDMNESFLIHLSNFR